eukprot:symbB.v1.2.033836.t2/scaffold4260.1/size42279/1
MAESVDSILRAQYDLSERERPKPHRVVKALSIRQRADLLIWIMQAFSVLGVDDSMVHGVALNIDRLVATYGGESNLPHGCLQCILLAVVCTEFKTDGFSDHPDKEWKQILWHMCRGQIPMNQILRTELRVLSRLGYVVGLPTPLTFLRGLTAHLRQEEQVDKDEVFLFTDVDVQYFQPIHQIVTDCMASGADIIFQKEFEDIGVNIGFMAIRNTMACHGFWDYVHAEISRTQALDQRVVNNSLYSGHAAGEFGLRWDRWPSEIWASSMAFSGPLPQSVAVHHANFLIDKAPSADPRPKLEQLKHLARELKALKEQETPWTAFMDAARGCQAMLDYRSRHFGERRPGPEWSTLEEGHAGRWISLANFLLEIAMLEPEVQHGLPHAFLAAGALAASLRVFDAPEKKRQELLEDVMIWPAEDSSEELLVRCEEELLQLWLRCKDEMVEFHDVFRVLEAKYSYPSRFEVAHLSPAGALQALREEQEPADFQNLKWMQWEIEGSLRQCDPVA